MLTQKRLKELVQYNPDTGVFICTEFHRGPKRLIGKEAGNRHCGGYIEMRLDGTAYLAHRLAWLYITGEWPKEEIDHKNGDRADNRFNNLRAVTKSVNMQNRKRADRDNRTGFLGVTKHGPSYRAQIQANGKSHKLGVYPTPEEAHAAYLKAKRKMHDGCTI